MTSVTKQRLGTGAFAWPDGEESRLIARSRFLAIVKLKEPKVLFTLAQLAGLDVNGRFPTCPGIGRVSLSTQPVYNVPVSPVSPAEIKEWAGRWHLMDPWLLTVARNTIDSWCSPTGGLLYEEHARKEGFDISSFIKALDWSYPVAVTENPLTEEDEQIPSLDPFFLSWNPRALTWENAEAGMVEAFLDHIREHRDRIQGLSGESGLVRTQSKLLRHFEWLALYQVVRRPDDKHYSQSDLSRTEGVTRQTINQAIRETASLIGLTLRSPGKAGHPA